MHEAFSGSPESGTQNSAELLELTPVNHEVYPIDSVQQRIIRGAMPLTSVGQESQVKTTETDQDRVIAQRAAQVGTVLPLLRHERVAALQAQQGGVRRAA